jgi:hypothetical protein
MFKLLLGFRCCICLFKNTVLILVTYELDVRGLEYESHMNFSYLRKSRI